MKDCNKTGMTECPQYELPRRVIIKNSRRATGIYVRSQAVFAIFFNLFCSLKRSCKNHNEQLSNRTEKSAKKRERKGSPPSPS
jgi:hypothetical protein